MELNKSNKKEYDLSSIQELFNEMESPRQLADDLAQLILNSHLLLPRTTSKYLRMIYQLYLFFVMR